MLIIFVIKLRTENSYINHIGLSLSKLYSIENYEYKKVYEKDDKQYLIIKRLGDKVYYEKQLNNSKSNSSERKETWNDYWMDTQLKEDRLFYNF